MRTVEIRMNPKQINSLFEELISAPKVEIVGGKKHIIIRASDHFVGSLRRKFQDEIEIKEVCPA